MAGRKGQYDEWLTEDGLLKIKGWARDGYSNKEIAHNIGIRPDTFSKWLGKFDQLNQAIKKGREPILVKLEDNLLSKTEWRLVEETEEELFIDSNGKKSKRIKTKKRWIPPDTATLIFVAKNYMPDKYKDKPEPKYTDEYEDSGLISVISNSIPDDEYYDDSDFLPELEEGDTDGKEA